MRFKTVYALSLVVFLLCALPSLEGKGKPKPEANPVAAGFICDQSDPQPVCTTYSGILDGFDRVAMGSFYANYESTDQIMVLESSLGLAYPGFVVNDPDGVCDWVGDFTGQTIDDPRFRFSGNNNTYEAVVSWVFEKDIDGDNDLEKMSFFCRDENFTEGNQGGDPFEDQLTLIKCVNVYARIEGYIPAGKKRGKTIQCGWSVSADFTVDDQ